MSLEKYKDIVLLTRLENYDNKYKDAILKPRREQSWGYSMRAYYSNKVSNPPEWKIKFKAEEVAKELTKRNVKFSTVYLRLSK